MAKVNLSTRGVLAFSIDLDPPASVMGIPQGQRLADTTQRLVDLFDAHAIRATWAVGEPSQSAAAQRIRQRLPGHEIAVLGDSSWIGPGTTRAQFSKQLSRRLLSARAAGIDVSTLIPGDEAIGDHLDLIVKHQVAAVRGLIDRHGSARTPAQPGALHFGLWEVPGSLRLPGSSRWIRGGGRGWTARRGIDQAAATRRLFHLVLSAPELAAAGDRSMATLERIVRHAARRLAAERIEVRTLGEIAARLSQKPKRSSSRSVLRVAG